LVDEKHSLYNSLLESLTNIYISAMTTHILIVLFTPPSLAALRHKQLFNLKIESYQHD